MKKICVQCQKEFELTESEIAFYKNKGLSIPKRCKACRELNKNGRSQNTVANSYNQSPPANQKKNSNKVNPVLPVVALVLVIVLAVVLISSGGSDSSGNIQNNGYSQQYEYTFANESLWVEHFNKHRYEFGYATKEDYLNGAINVINNPNALTRTQDDGDTCYYLQATDEFVVVSSDGNIRTYFKPGDGDSQEGYEYFLRQQIEALFLLAS
jgi:hypothetical protein